MRVRRSGPGSGDLLAATGFPGDRTGGAAAVLHRLSEDLGAAEAGAGEETDGEDRGGVLGAGGFASFKALTRLNDAAKANRAAETDGSSDIVCQIPRPASQRHGRTSR